jgi:hypothetical protein
MEEATMSLMEKMMGHMLGKMNKEEKQAMTEKVARL